MMSLLYVYDLDNTLYLWKASPTDRATYEAKLKKHLYKLKHSGVIVTVASYNLAANERLVSMGIRDTVSLVVCPKGMRRGRPDDPELEDKASMVLGICRAFPHIPRKDVRFFDDDVVSVEAVERLGIASTTVSAWRGIPMP